MINVYISGQCFVLSETALPLYLYGSRKEARMEREARREGSTRAVKNGKFCRHIQPDPSFCRVFYKVKFFSKVSPPIPQQCRVFNTIPTRRQVSILSSISPESTVIPRFTSETLPCSCGPEFALLTIQVRV